MHRAPLRDVLHDGPNLIRTLENVTFMQSM